MGKRTTTTAAILVAAITVGAALARPADVRLSDLSVYLGAVSGLADGASLYDFTRGAAPFTYPPFAALLVTPLTWLPVTLVQVAWSFATVAAVAGLARLVLPRHAALAALVLLLSAPIASNIKYGQVSLFLAALVALDLLALRRTPWHGALIGVAAAIKLTPLIFVPLLWFSGRRTAAVTAAGTFAACGMVAALVLPGDSWRFWTTEMFRVDRLGYITGAGNQSLNGALMRLEVGAPVRSLIVLVIGGAVAVPAIRRGARLAREGDSLSAMIVVGAAGVVLSPVSWTHHQVWLVLAALLPVPKRTLWIGLVLIVMLLPTAAFEARLLLAVTVAAVLPLTTTAREPLRAAAEPATAPR
jgi:alpha-1,2-mannosyltransferase